MKPRVLYIASGGIEEPLIVSQVLRYLKQLNSDFEVCHLLTLERSMPENSDTIKRKLANENIHWHGLKSRSGMRAINLWREIFAGYRIGKKLIYQHDLNLIHARSFIPGNIGLSLAKKTGIKLLFDMRGFWSEEKQAKGTIRADWMFRVAKSMEDRILRQADALISLTQAGKKKLEEDGIQTPIYVIPCCVDTELFRPRSDSEASSRREPTRYICVGSLGPGYLPETVIGFFQVALDGDPESQLQLLTRAEPERVKQIANTMGCDWSRVQFDSVGPEKVVDYLHESDVGLCLIQPSPAKIASSPTKLAEYLACGLPVVANAEMIGDVGEILSKHRVGVVMDRFDTVGFTEAIEKLKHLFADPDLKQRCRKTAVEHFSVEIAVRRYAEAYQQLLAGK